MTQGLTSAQANQLLQIHGKNILKTQKKKLLILQFLEEFKDLMVIILIIATIISFAAGEAKDGSVIIFIVLLNAIIGFVQKFRAEKAVEALQKMLAPHARVIRDKKEIIIPAENLVPGDLLILEEGDLIGADAKILEENEFEIQEAVLTGESTPVKKEKESRIFMGTTATHGNAKALVENTGMKTSFGKITHLTAITEKDLSPLQKELNHIGIFIGKITLVIAGILVLAGTLIQQKPLLKTILFAASVAVAAVPEGLPATVTIALALGVQRLAAKKAIVKQLSSVETLGSTTVIVSDKTGTLTKNEMTVKKLLLGNYDISLGEEKFIPDETHIETLTLACCVSSLCSNAKFSEHSRAQVEEQLGKVATISKPQIIGDPTEAALLNLSEKIGLTEKIMQEKFIKIHEFPFDSKRKRMSVISQKKSSKNLYIWTKGAPNAVLDVCSKILKNGKEIPLTEEKKQEILKKNDEMANSALRVIALAYKKVEEQKDRKTGRAERVRSEAKNPAPQVLSEASFINEARLNQKNTENNLIFIGLTGIMDPPRLEVPAAIKAAEKAGIRIFIVTGDHGLTATAIAKIIGFVKKNEEPRIITGQDLDNMSDKELENILKVKKLRANDSNNADEKTQKIIFARVKPEDKLRIVSALKNLDEIVAVTGDGVNDAPALKRADIGIAMGITGTDVSKEAANMVLADDSFATIVSAIEEGRTIYENIKKFLMYIFSSNVGELIVIFTALIAGLSAPLTAILILLINVGTDVLPALALGLDSAEKDFMEKPPRKTSEHILQKKFIARIFFLGPLVGITSLAAYLYELRENSWQWSIKASTLTFVTLVLGQMANAYNSRSSSNSAFKNFFKNPMLFISIIISILFIIAITEIPLLQQYMEVSPLEPKDWLIALLLASTVLVFEEIRKLFHGKSKTLRD